MGEHPGSSDGRLHLVLRLVGDDTVDAVRDSRVVHLALGGHQERVVGAGHDALDLALRTQGRHDGSPVAVVETGPLRDDDQEAGRPLLLPRDVRVGDVGLVLEGLLHLVDDASDDADETVVVFGDLPRGADPGGDLRVDREHARRVVERRLGSEVHAVADVLDQLVDVVELEARTTPVDLDRAVSV